MPRTGRPTPGRRRADRLCACRSRRLGALSRLFVERTGAEPDRWYFALAMVLNPCLPSRHRLIPRYRLGSLGCAFVACIVKHGMSPRRRRSNSHGYCRCLRWQCLSPPASPVPWLARPPHPAPASLSRLAAASAGCCAPATCRVQLTTCTDYLHRLLAQAILCKLTLLSTVCAS